VPHASWLVTRGDEVLAAHEPERMFSSASMIKTFLLAAALDRGDLAEEVVVEERVDGDGVLKLLDLPVRRPLKELLALMIAISDNTATRAVVKVLGESDAVNAWLAARGFASRLGRGRESVERLAPGLPSRPGLGATSAAEHERILRELTPLGVEMLCEQQDRRALARALDESRHFAHKTGTIDRVRHDGGVLLDLDPPLFIHAFTDGGPVREWVDHPACVGMGIAMQETLEWLASR
jgi:beta-lactamase class A